MENFLYVAQYDIDFIHNQKLTLKRFLFQITFNNKSYLHVQFSIQYIKTAFCNHQWYIMKFKRLDIYLYTEISYS